MIDNFDYNPSTSNITIGTNVTWIDHDSARHRATPCESGKRTIIDSGLMNEGESFFHIFDYEGEIPYYCSAHPIMIGKVIVEDRDHIISSEYKQHIPCMHPVLPCSCSELCPEPLIILP